MAGTGFLFGGSAMFLGLAGGLGGLGWFWRAKDITERRLYFLLGVTSAFCMWLMWVIIYMAQMNPLVKPILQLQ